MLKRISDKEIVNAMKPPIVGSQEYYESAREDKRIFFGKKVTQAQLEADLKAIKDMVEITPVKAKGIIKIINDYCRETQSCYGCKDCLESLCALKWLLNHLKPIVDRK